MPTASPQEPNNQLKPGEIKLDLIPAHWPLTPLKDKRAYVAGWTSQPYSIDRVQEELKEGRATGVGLISGQWSNEGGLIWIDIDGPDAIPELEKLGGGPLDTIFPPTLTISSGKPGRQRMLYSIPTSKLRLLPDKATIKIGVPSFEILFRSRQGAIMGSHPDTDGYHTTSHGGFEFAKNPPELPEWLYEAITKAFPTNKYRKSPSVGVVTQQVNLSYEEGSEYQKEDLLNEAKIYLDHLKPERAVDYEEWITVGAALHQIDETLLAEWIEWSSEAPNFEDGVCEKKWETFERQPGGPAPEGCAGLHTLRAKAKEDGFVEFGGFVVESSPEVLAKRAKALFKENAGSDKKDIAKLNTALKEIIGKPTKKEKEEIEQEVKSKGRPKTPPASELADFVTGMVIECGWRYDPKFDTFMFYQRSKGTWRREDYRQEYKHFVQDLFLRENIPTPGGFTSHLLSDVVNLTQAYITHTYWDDDDDRLAFRNGVLEISSGEFLEHNPEHYLTWGLDFDYEPKAVPGPIIDWLKRTQFGDEERVQVLRAWLKACLIGQGHELQRFLEVIGPGGRGKSTFANLCCALVGHGNYASTTLNQLEQSRFEVASIILLSSQSKRQTIHLV